MGESAPLIFVIVLNWNGCADTLECLASLQRVDYPNFNVIVVDNGSADATVDSVHTRFPAIRVIENDTNLGFAEGNNRGIADALSSDAEFVLLLNNDTTVDPQFLQALVRAAARFPGAGIFGPKIYYHSDPQRVWYAGGYWDPLTLSFGEYGAGEIDRGQFDTPAETEWVIGCAMFIRAEIFRCIGNLEPKFFLNNEEIDFCSRVRRAGYSCVYVPDARVWHKISVSFGGENSPLKEYFSARNRLLWASRNAERPLRWRIHLSVFRTLGRRFLSPALSGSVGGSDPLRQRWWSIRAAFSDPRNRAYALGVRDFYLGRFGDCPSRVRELAKDWSQRARDTIAGAVQR
jgi:GT2 family glycosyltransferase